MNHFSTEGDGLISSLAISKDKLFSGSNDERICLWDLQTLKLKSVIQPSPKGYVNNLILNETETILFASGYSENLIYIWDISNDNKTPLPPLQGHTARICSLRISGILLFSSSDDKTLRIWDISSMCTIYSASVESIVKELQIEDSGLLFSISNSETTIRVWNTIDGFNGHSRMLKTIESKKTFIEETSWKNTMQLLDPLTLDIHSSFQDNECEFITVESNYILTISGNIIKVWDEKDWSCVAKLEEHTRKVTSVRIVEGHLISCSIDGVLKIWTTNPEFKCLKTLKLSSKEITSLCVDSENLVIGSTDASIRIISTKDLISNAHSTETWKRTLNVKVHEIRNLPKPGLKLCFF